MAVQPKGELVPTGGGDSIPLIRDELTLGRRESCDVCLRFPNVSGVHCQLSYRNGYWHVRDMNSTNGVKVNGERVQERVLRPRDEITIGKRDYVIEYAIDDGSKPPAEPTQEEILSQPLLERAGLAKPTSSRGARQFRRPEFEDFEVDWTDEDFKPA